MKTLVGALLLTLLVVTRAAAQAVDTVRVEVDGHRMQLLVDGTGGPTVVLESGDRSTHRTWNRLRDSLRTFTRVVAYDRAGLGASEFCARPRNAQTIATELRAALKAARIPPPYLLVGHSAGGLFVRVFASLFPGDVSGVLLLDPSAEDFYPRAEREYPEVYRRLDAADSAERASTTPGESAEDDAWETSLQQAKASDARLRAPVVLLSSPRQDLEVLNDLYRDEQQRWVARQRNATFRIVARTGHAIQRDRPDTVIAVIRALRARGMTR